MSTSDRPICGFAMSSSRPPRVPFTVMDGPTATLMRELATAQSRDGARLTHCGCKGAGLTRPQLPEVST